MDDATLVSLLQDFFYEFSEYADANWRQERHTEERKKGFVL